MITWLFSYFTRRNLEQRLNLIPVDFNKPWWQIIWDQRGRAAFVFIGLSITYAFSTQLPIYLGYIIEHGRTDLFWVLSGTWIVFYLFEYFVRMTNTVFQVHCIHSIHFAAQQFFMQVDPVFHSDRSSGVVINKTQRASLAYEDLLDSFTSSGLLELIIRALTVIISFFAINMTLGSIALATVVALTVSNLMMFKRVVPQHEQQFLEADDKLKAMSVENLAQVSLIRASFATNESINRLREKNTTAMRHEAYFWKAFIDIRVVFKNLYVLAVCTVGAYLLHLVHQDLMHPMLATTLILTYLRGTDEIIKIDKPLRAFLRSYTRITNFYDFIRQFGTQTYPVLSPTGILEEKPHAKEDREISIVAEKMHFDYTDKAKIFDGHSIHLQVPGSQKPKLFGVIGPSGSGKTTLISILGGQLKPNQGTVCINGTDIYTIDDHARRNLISLQGQVASNLRGTLTYNLLFGIPKNLHTYAEDDLISVLERVGLWRIFKEKKGLRTFIGEGGLNLSGGQRQRLNFAGLYLRARYFKPAIVLIDEPTSSLDEVSERAITDMIIELAQSMVTIVIAHRLKTLDAATGIMDFSLISEEREMRFYTLPELQNRSKYYQKLLHGEVSIED